METRTIAVLRQVWRKSSRMRPVNRMASIRADCTVSNEPLGVHGGVHYNVETSVRWELWLDSGDRLAT